jgi:hypothetical protein
VLHIPGFLERADRIKLLTSTGDDIKVQGHVESCCFQSSECRHAIQYLQDCDSLLKKLYHWLESLQKLEKGPVWWYPEASALTARMQPRGPSRLVHSRGSCEAHRSSMIHFSSPKIPGLLIQYWGGLLELSISILEVRNLTHCVTNSASLGVESLSMSIDVDRPSKLAVRICQTAMHLGSSLEGCTMAYIPVRLAEKHFTHLLSLDWENEWGQDCDRLRHYERARIGLECSKKALEILENTTKLSVEV